MFTGVKEGVKSAVKSGTYRQGLYRQRRDLGAGKIVVIGVSASHHILDNVEIVPAQGHAIYRMNNLTVLAPESVRSDTQFSTHRIATRITFQAGDQQALGE